MKTLLACLVLLVAPSSYAWVVKDNPDRVPSLGFHISSEKLSGETDLVTEAGMTNVTESRTGLDLKLPVNSNFTLTFGYTGIDQESKFKSDIPRFEHSSLTGSNYSFEARIYLDK